jgi:hypothetical protein
MYYVWKREGTRSAGNTLSGVSPLCSFVLVGDEKPYFIFSTLQYRHPGSNMSDPGPSKDDSPRSPTPSSSNSLTDHLFRDLTLHPSVSTARSQLPRRTPQEEREFLASVIREAMSIIDDGLEDADNDDGSADDDGDRGASGNSDDCGDIKQ